MLGCCGFLSFSWVFCLLGGRLETTLYIHFTRRWVKARRHSSARRKGKDEKRAEKNAILRSWRFCRGRVCRQGGPVQLTTSASRTYWTSPLSRNTYTASLTAATAIHHVSVPGVGGATTPFTTSTAPTSANSLRRLRLRVRRSMPHCRGVCETDFGRLQKRSEEEERAVSASSTRTCGGASEGVA
jgi:hypothetical protein